MNRQKQWLFEAPFPSQLTYYADPCVDRESYNYPEALFAFKDKEVEEKELPIEQMRNYLQDIWNKKPIVKRMAKLYRDLRENQDRALRTLDEDVKKILYVFERLEGIQVEIVDDETIQRQFNGLPNFASLQTRPGFLQIERNVLRDPIGFLKEASHEINAHLTNWPKSMFFIRINNRKRPANRLLDEWVMKGRPPSVLNVGRKLY
jgi:hypothetical protein